MQLELLGIMFRSCRSGILKWLMKFKKACKMVFKFRLNLQKIRKYQTRHMNLVECAFNGDIVWYFEPSRYQDYARCIPSLPSVASNAILEV